MTGSLLIKITSAPNCNRIVNLTIILHQEAEFLTGFRSLESMGLCKILIQKVLGILILVGRLMLQRKETLMLYGIRNIDAVRDSKH